MNISYAYDASGRRIRQVVNGTTIRYNILGNYTVLDYNPSYFGTDPNEPIVFVLYKRQRGAYWAA